jgi:KaiC/GvpD/RAD55 family RecA-like ATPase
MELKEIKEEIEEQKRTKKEGDEIVLLSELAKIEESKRSERYPTGINIFDRVFLEEGEKRGGLSGGEILIVAAPTGNGKTLLAATIAYNMMREHGLFFLFFTFEVKVSSLYRIFKNMGANDDDIICVPFKHTTGRLDWIEKKILEAKKRFMVKTIVIDHLGFLSPIQTMNSNMSQNYSTFLTQTVRELKLIAVKHNIIIILPVHMNKTATDTPKMADIGNSSGIAQESDGVILMARKESEAEYYSDISSVFMGKNRPGGKHPKWFMSKQQGKLQEINYEQKKDDFF